MAIKVAIRHQTSYEYDRPVNLSPHTFRLRPAAHCRTPILSYSLNIKPEKHFINWQQDPFGNFLARVVFPDKATSLSFEVEVIARNNCHQSVRFFYRTVCRKISIYLYNSVKKGTCSLFRIERVWNSAHIMG